MKSYFPPEPVEYLQNEYSVRRKRRPHYSLRAFARDLEISPAALCEFLRGKAGFSHERVVWLGKKLQLTEEQTEHFSDLVASRFNTNEEIRAQARARADQRRRTTARLANDQFEVVASWLHMVILELIEIHPRYQDSRQLAAALELPETEIVAAIDRLKRVGLLVREGQLLKTTAAQTLVGDGRASAAIRAYHHGMLDQASAALERVPVEKRNFRSVVFSLRSEDMAAFNTDLEKAMKTLVDKYHSSQGKNLVCGFNVQVFPFHTPEPKAPERNHVPR